MGHCAMMSNDGTTNPFLMTANSFYEALYFKSYFYLFGQNSHRVELDGAPTAKSFI